MDQQLLFLINHSWAIPVLDRPMAAASSFDFWWPFLLAGVILGAIFGNFRVRMFLLTAGLAVGLTDGVVVDSLKKFVNRPRPHEVLEGVRTLDLAKAKPRFLALGKPLKEEYSMARIAPAGGNSFPSGHAANNFAVATVCAVFFRRWGWLVYLPAAFVAYSRIYVGAHWPLDVLTSCFIGTGVGVLMSVVLEALWRRWGFRCWPGLYEKTPSLLAAR
ncbi:phosphatase PAP2 family protein [soil metagenome]